MILIYLSGLWTGFWVGVVAGAWLTAAPPVKRGPLRLDLEGDDSDDPRTPPPFLVRGRP